MRSGPSLRLELTPSPRFAALIVALHAAAAASVAAVVPGLAGALLAAALLALGLAAAWGRALLRSALSVRAIELDGPAHALLELGSGERLDVELGERRYVGRFAVSLPVARPVRRTVLVYHDMLAPDSFRRLRIWAAWGRLPGVAEKQLGA